MTNKNIDYAKELLAIAQEKGLRVQISLGKRENNTTQSVTINLYNKNNTVVHSNTASGKHFSLTTKIIAKSLISILQKEESHEPKTETTNNGTIEYKLNTTRQKPVVNLQETDTQIIDQFFVANVNPILIENTCPHCNNKLEKQVFDIPVFIQNNFKQYYKRELLSCPHCHIHFMTLNDWNNLVFDAYNTHKDIPTIPSAKNMRRRNRNENDDRSFIPLLEYNLYFEDDPKTNKDSFDGFWNGMNKESDLKKLGYTTKLKTNERIQIMEEFIQQYGVFKLISLLQFHIKTHDHCLSAQKIWQQDLNYAQSRDPRRLPPRQYVI